MSAYVANNPILYNAALSGIIAAALAGVNPSGTGAAVMTKSVAGDCKWLSFLWASSR